MLTRRDMRVPKTPEQVSWANTFPFGGGHTVESNPGKRKPKGQEGANVRR